MANFFKPRRGTQLKAKEVLKGDENRLKAGELFFELEYVGNTKTVKSGRIMIGDGHSDYEQLVTDKRYVFNPDDYMGVTSKFEPTPSTETTITANRNIINSANTNIKEKLGAVSKSLDILSAAPIDIDFINTDDDKGIRFKDFKNNYKLVEIDYANKAAANADGVSLDQFVKSISKGSGGHIKELVVQYSNSSTPDYISPEHAHTADYATNANQASNASTAEYATLNGFGRSNVYTTKYSASFKLLEPKGTDPSQGYSYSALIYTKDSNEESELYFYARYEDVQGTGFSSMSELFTIKDNEYAGCYIKTAGDDKSTVNLVARTGGTFFVHIFVLSGDFKFFAEE